MRILVTGGAGFIGSHIIDALLTRGHEVRVLDSLEPPVHAQRARPAHLPAEVELITGSITDRDALSRALDRAEAVFHLAARQDYLNDFSQYFRVNSVGTALLYELIVSQQLPIRKVVLASSQASYGEGKYLCNLHGTQYPDERSLEQMRRAQWDVACDTCRTPMQALPTDESVQRPNNTYALSKRDQEAIALKLGSRFGIPTVALRYSIVQGPRQSHRNAYSGALRSFAIRVLTGGSPLAFEDGQQLRDYVSIHDVVRANLLVLEDDRANYRAFNVGGDRQVSVLDLAWMVIRAAGSRTEPQVSGLFRVGDVRHIFSDVTSLRAFGWEPCVTQAEAVREYVEWAAEQADLSDTVTEAVTRMRAEGVLQPVGAV